MYVFLNRGKLEDYKPVIDLRNGTYLISWDKTPVLEEELELVNSRFVKTGKLVPTGFYCWCSAVIDFVPTPDEVENLVFEYINSNTRNQIVNNFIWNGYSVNLSDENQRNYKAAFDLAMQTDGESLPVKFKFAKDGKTEYYVFTLVDELKDFYLKANKHINTCLERGWAIKDNFVKSDYHI